MNTSSLLLRPRRLGSLLGFSVIALGALSPARADFIPTNTGPHDYNTVTNWDSDIINGVFSNTLTGNQTVTFGADTALTTGLTFQFGGAFNMTLRGTGAARTITLGGDISLDSVADGRTVTLGSTTSGQELNITLGASRSISVAGTDTLKLVNVVSGNTGIDITKTGAGTLALDGNNAGNFKGSININAGTVTNNGTFQAAFGTGVINLGDTSGSADATLRGGGNKNYNTAINIRAGSTGTLTIGHYAPVGQNGTATFSGALKIDNNFTVDGSGTGVIVSGAVSSATGGTFKLTKTGVGVVTWGTNSGNDYSNLTLNIDVTEGTLRAGGGNGTNAFDTKGVVTVSSGATFDVFNKRPSIGALVGAGTVTQSTSTNTNSLTLNGVSDAVFTGTLADGSKDGYNVIKTGSARQTLSGDNSYRGTTTITGGVLEVNSLADGGVVGTLTTTKDSTAATVADATGLAVGQTVSGSGIATGTTITAINGTAITLSQAATANTTALSAGFGTANGLGISTNAAANLVLNGGTLRYTGAAASTDRQMQIGQTTADGAGTLDASGSGAVQFTNTGAITYGTANQTRTLTLTGTNTGANTLATGIANNGSGVVNLNKTGAGTWVLGGANAYTGATSVSGGALLINGDQSAATGAVNVASGATLGGSGIIGGATTVASGGFLAPGNSPGTLTFNAGLTLAGTYTWQLGALSTTNPGVNFDQIVITAGAGDFTGASLALDLGLFAPSADAFWSSDRSWLIVDNTGAGSITGSFTLTTDQSAWASYGSFSVGNVGNDVALSWTAVPEPGTVAVLFGGVALGVAAVVRRRRTAKTV